VNAYRLFTNDVGPNAFSCLARVMASDAATALKENSRTAGIRYLVIADDQESLKLYGPDGKTGELPPDRVLEQGRKKGLVAGPKRHPG
jgi:hypothetical protein